ncbi:hypothetical protein HMPREF1554_01821 [Porphyromonas gingivalis F0569]|nr:hypothetical protein HMPREF1554_01821 [Porphyromonas gingivalis F0569]
MKIPCNILKKREAASFGTVPGGSLLWIHFNFNSKWFSGFSEDLELSVHKSRANRINRQRKKYVVQQVHPYPHVESGSRKVKRTLPL